MLIKTDNEVREMKKSIKTIHEVFALGSRAVINKQNYQLEEIMLCGTSEFVYTNLKFKSKDNDEIVCSVNIENNEIQFTSSELSAWYHDILQIHNKRLLKNESVNSEDCITNSIFNRMIDTNERIIEQKNVKPFKSEILISEKKL